MWKLGGLSSLLVFVIFCSNSAPAEAYDPLDPFGNITIKWDIMKWTSDGYLAAVTIRNFQQYRHIEDPGWSLGWTWAKKEVIWSMTGAQAADQGDCSRFRLRIPHCCKKKPSIVDLLPETASDEKKQVANCCKGGVLTSWAEDPEGAVAFFQLNVGSSGNSNTTVRLPKNYTLKTPGPGYTCGPARVGKPSKFFSRDGRRTTQAMMTWKVRCSYSQFLANEAPRCCVSLSSFYNDKIVKCPTCACGCAADAATTHRQCVESDSPLLKTAVARRSSDKADLVRCTSHMCPIRVHWHIKLNYKEYWRVKVSITNFNYRKNYTGWNLVLQHPNFNNVNQVFSFNYTSLSPYGSLNDTAMLWGLKHFNEILMAAGPKGNVQSEILLRKDASSFTLQKGWAFPRRVYFNGDNCAMPPPDSYPWLPNSSTLLLSSSSLIFGMIWLVLLL